MKKQRKALAAHRFEIHQTSSAPSSPFPPQKKNDHAQCQNLMGVVQTVEYLFLYALRLCNYFILSTYSSRIELNHDFSNVFLFLSTVPCLLAGFSYQTFRVKQREKKRDRRFKERTQSVIFCFHRTIGIKIALNSIPNIES